MHNRSWMYAAAYITNPAYNSCVLLHIYTTPVTVIKLTSGYETDICKNYFTKYDASFKAYKNMNKTLVCVLGKPFAKARMQKAYLGRYMSPFLYIRTHTQHQLV